MYEYDVELKIQWLSRMKFLLNFMLTSHTKAEYYY